MNNYDFRDLDPESEIGIKKFLEHQKMFLEENCYFAESNNVCQRVAVFGKVYRTVWLTVLNNRKWSDEELFLGFIDFFMDYAMNDKEILDFIDKEKWFLSERLKQDVFYDFNTMKVVGEDLSDFIIRRYFATA